MKKLDWYIIKKFYSTFFFAILVLAVISCVIDYSEKVDNIVSKKAPTLVVLNYYISNLIYYDYSFTMTFTVTKLIILYNQME